MSFSMKINNISKDISMNELKDRFLLSSLNSSRESLTYSNILSVLDVDRMKVQNNNSF